jgi:signal transduction histidine kinase
MSDLEATTVSRPMQIGVGIIESCIDGKVVWLDELADFMLPSRFPVTSRSSLTNAVVAPILSGDAVFGFIAIYDGEHIPDEQGVRSMFTSVTSLIGQFLHRREAENRARHAMLVAQREEFITTLAHDLKTPIAGANRVYELFLDGVVGELNPRQSELLRKLKQSGESQLKMIQNLLEMYRFEAGTSVIELTETAIDELVERCVSALQPLADAQKVRIKVTAQASRSVPADSIAMTRVFQNLLDNALKYSSSQGDVEVRTWSEEGCVKVAVRDSGKGIAPDLQPLLFQRFSQGRNRSSIGGSGIGLYLSKQIVEAHGGTLSFVSEPGQGSTFTVSLPSRPLLKSSFVP